MQIDGNDAVETKMIDSLAFEKTHKTVALLLEEQKRMETKLTNNGFFDWRLLKQEKINDSSFVFTYNIGKPIKNNTIYIGTLSEEEKKYAENLFKKYRVEYGDWEKLYSRLIIYPTSLILTQGAIEIGWGTSSFFKEGNNLFGMCCTIPNEPRIPAKRVRENGFVPHLKKYDSVKGSVSDFVLNFSRNKAYTNLRKLLRENQPPQIVAGA